MLKIVRVAAYAPFEVLDIPGHTRARMRHYRPGTPFRGETLLEPARGFAATRGWKNRF